MEQSKLHQHATTIYLSHTIADFAEALAAKMPGNLKVVYFVNSGSEANELAMLMARLYTGNLEMISLKMHKVLGEIHHVINPNPYRGIFGSDPTGYAKGVQDHIDYGSSGKGVGGAVELAPGYLTMVYDIVRKAGGVCIADEVQSGFGHTGSHYWGFETQGVTPDIVTMAKTFNDYMNLDVSDDIAWHPSRQSWNPLKCVPYQTANMFHQRRCRLSCRSIGILNVEVVRNYLPLAEMNMINNGPVVSGYSGRKHLSVNVGSDD
uniref:alanine--glyoxylate transaminase n=1 Tax=Populus alba TaxID=43335 RepID=A0A4U5N8E3_POPAL|nr:hypothetical protein D5086_0000280300 [Populus alba]